MLDIQVRNEQRQCEEHALKMDMLREENARKKEEHKLMMDLVKKKIEKEDFKVKLARKEFEGAVKF